MPEQAVNCSYVHRANGATKEEKPHVHNGTFVLPDKTDTPAEKTADAKPVQAKK